MRWVLLTILMTLILTLVPWGTVGAGYDFTHAELVYAVDGDTVKVNLCNVHPILGEKINIRVKGIDADEITPKATATRRAFEARSFVQNELHSAAKISLKDCDKGKYFRLACDIWYDEKNLSQELLTKELAVPYMEK